jgi:hypothetical protein
MSQKPPFIGGLDYGMTTLTVPAISLVRVVAQPVKRGGGGCYMILENCVSGRFLTPI